MSRLEELADKHRARYFEHGSPRPLKDLFRDFGRELLEEAARLAETPGGWGSIAAAIRSLADSGERRGDGEA